MRPIGVNFTIPQGELPRLRRAMAAGPVTVETIPEAGPGRSAAPLRGTVQTLDNQVDAATGTVKVKAVFPNEETSLWPGAFVSLRLAVETVPDAVVVPLVAVQQGPSGPYAFVVSPEGDRVGQRPLVLGAVTQTEAAIRDGLQAGERVVISGGLRLNDGSSVVLADPAAPAAPTAGGSQPRRQRRAEAAP